MLATLPNPTLSFTLPSLFDSSKLSCRVYHPENLPWSGSALIVAHPYAPLGGCQDDPVVHAIAAASLRLGLVAATFNFRGAPGSDGRTSWTSKPEIEDYMSVVGFMLCYSSYWSPTSPIAIVDKRPILLLAGYSYGALVTTQLPALPAILRRFVAPETGSPAAEIRLRAQHLATSARALLLGQPSRGTGQGLRVGGDEDPDYHRKSHETCRPALAELVAKAKRSASRSKSRSQVRNHLGPAVAHELKARQGEGLRASGEHHHQNLPAIGSVFRPAYLLVSPPLGLVSNLVTLSVPNPFAKKHKQVAQPDLWDNVVPPGPPAEGSDVFGEAELKLVQNPTLALFGDRDIFVSAKRLRQWASRLGATRGSRFRAHEISRAGHFWAEDRVLYALVDAAKTFAKGLLVD